MTSRRLFATEHAQQGDALKMTFDAATSKAFQEFTVSMTSPEPSTGGGLRALQHITLTAADGVVLVVGSANHVEKTAELRTLGYMLAISRERFGIETRLPLAEYVVFLEEAIRVLESFGMAVTVAAFAKPEEAPVIRKGSERSRGISLYSIVFASVVAVGGAVGWMVSQ